MRRRLGFSLLEAILAVATISTALISLVTIFGSGSRRAIATRDRTAAILKGQSLMEEITAHPYGAPAPKMWPVDTQDTFEYNVRVEGKKREMVFTWSLTFANGSAIGKGAGEPWDRATTARLCKRQRCPAEPRLLDGVGPRLRQRGALHGEPLWPARLGQARLLHAQEQR